MRDGVCSDGSGSAAQSTGSSRDLDIVSTQAARGLCNACYWI